MSNKKPTQQQQNHHANQLNSNKGTSGQNQANAKVHGNRGKHMNPNQKPYTKKHCPVLYGIGLFLANKEAE